MTVSIPTVRGFPVRDVKTIAAVVGGGDDAASIQAEAHAVDVSRCPQVKLLARPRVPFTASFVSSLPRPAFASSRPVGAPGEGRAGCRIVSSSGRRGCRDGSPPGLAARRLVPGDVDRLRLTRVRPDPVGPRSRRGVSCMCHPSRSAARDSLSDRDHGNALATRAAASVPPRAHGDASATPLAWSSRTRRLPPRCVPRELALSLRIRSRETTAMVGARGQVDDDRAGPTRRAGSSSAVGPRHSAPAARLSLQTQPSRARRSSPAL